MQIFSKELEEFSLLRHPFYRAWDAGKLSMRDLQEYACQYYNHVNETPRYLSSIHSKCSDIAVRQIILDNLIDEEKGEENHPKLWRDFAEALGVNPEKVTNAVLSDESKNLSSVFFEATHTASEGIGALYAYERQIPEIARVKIEGLKEFYGIEKAKDIRFFTVHMEADIWHSDDCESLIKNMSLDEQKKAKLGAIKLAKAFWGFLDGMERMRLNQQYINV